MTTATSRTPLASSATGWGTFSASSSPLLSPKVEDVNGDNRITALDEARNLADEARLSARACATAARRHAAIEWWLSVLLIFVNAVTVASGVGTAASSGRADDAAASATSGFVWAFATAGMSALAGVMAGLRQALQPAERAAQCKAGAREFERLYREMDYLQRLVGLSDDEAADRVRKAMDELARAEQPDAVADALVRFKYAGCPSS